MARLDGERPNPLPNSCLLQFDLGDASEPKDDYEPLKVLIHPQSYFQFDMDDITKTKSLVPPLPMSNATLRFPTLSAFIDSLIDTLLDPVIGYRHRKYGLRLSTYLAYLRLYVF